MIRYTVFTENDLGNEEFLALDECGHKHKTFLNAVLCRTKLGMESNTWLGSKIIRSNGFIYEEISPFYWKVEKIIPRDTNLFFMFWGGSLNAKKVGR